MCTYFCICELRQLKYGTTGKILFSISARQEVSVKSILGHFWKNWNEWNSNPGARHDGGPPSW